MKKNNSFAKILSAVFLFSFLLLPVNAQKLPEQSSILKKMTIANKYFMDKWPDVGKVIVTNKARPSNIWTRGVYYEGLMALYSIDPKPVYYQYAVDWADFHHWNFRDGVYTRNADNQCAGQTYLDLYQIDPKPERIKNTKTSIDSMMRTNKIDDWDWIDALQMGMPVFAKLGVILDDTAYFNRMWAMYNYTKTREGGNGLYNPKDSLWWRDKDFDPPYTEPNGEDCYWSRGNGWVLAALTRVLDIMPEDAPHWNEYLETYKEMVKAIAEVQRQDGFWNVSLHDPNHFGGKELSGTALFTYGMAWGINKGVISEKKYKPIVAKAWNAMANEAVHPGGFLGYVQGTGKEPKDGQPVSYDHQPDFEDYGLGCFLLAGGEVYKLAGQDK